MPDFRRSFFRPGRDRDAREREVDEEIAAHLSMRVDELVASGMTHEEAEAEARRRFGDLPEASRKLRRSGRRRDRRLGWAAAWDGLRQDLVLAVREMRRSRSTTAVEWTTIAVGVALASVAFALVDQVLLRPLPFPEPESLVALYSVPESGMEDAFPWVSSENWLDWREGNRTLEQSALHFYDVGRGAVLVDGVARAYGVSSVSADFFQVLRPGFLVGRGFSSEEVEAGSSVVVSEGFWRSVLGEPASLEGVSVVLDGERRDVVGVVDGDRIYPEGTEIWAPRSIVRRGDAMRNNINFLAIARLRDGVSPARAQRDLSAIAEVIRSRAPEARYSHGVAVRPMREVVLGSSIEDQLHLVLGGVLVLLLAGVVNLSGLNLARATERRPETAVRLALGSGRARLVQAHLTRHLLLAAAGAIGAVVLSRVGLELVRAYAGDAIPRSSELAVDLRVVAVAVLLALLAGVGAGVTAALRASSVSLSDAMRSSGGGDPARWRGAGGRVVVAAQVALACVLLVGSALLIRSFDELTDRELGFDPDGVVTARVVLSPPEYRSPDLRRDFWSRMLAATERLPGAQVAAIVNAVPLSDGGTGFTDIEDDPGRETGAGYRVVQGDYFDALGMSLLRGRGLDDDGPGLETSTVVNEAMAESHWPGEDPIGKRVRATSMERGGDGSPAPWRTVVGVVEDIRHGGFDAAPRPEMYVHIDGASIYHTGAMFLVARAPGGGTPSLTEALRATVQDDDPRLVPEVSRMSDRVAEDVMRPRLLAGVLTLFGIMALVVASLGVYGLLAFAVRQRTREIGIRSAIGADRTSIVGLVVRDALALALVGVVTGLVVAWFGREVVAAQIVEVSPSDPVSFAVAGIVPLALAWLAALLPATRAARIDPVSALKEQG